jgi:hypothetical protein
MLIFCPCAAGVGSPLAGNLGQSRTPQLARQSPYNLCRATRGPPTASGAGTLTAMANRASPASDAARLLAADPATPALADLLRTKGAIEPAQDGKRLRGDREGQGRGKSIRRAWSGRAVRRAPLSSDPPGWDTFTPARERIPSACMAGTPGLRIAPRRPPGIAPLETPGGPRSGSEAGNA